jgi:mono/diheme cytochrome c family protein
MKKQLALLIVSGVLANAGGFNPSMQGYIDSLKVEAKKSNNSFADFNAKRGELIFTSKHIGKRGREISCASCHGANLSLSSQNAFTNKSIEPLSPRTNPKRLTNVQDVQKWLKRNFNDVYKREGTPQEKGDVLYYIKSK